MKDFFDAVYCSSSARMAELEPLSVDLILTSPPYETMRHYSDDPEDLGNYQGLEYVTKLKAVLAECKRVLKPGGNLFLNFQAQIIDGLTSPTEYLIVKMAVEELGLLHVQTHTWVKPNANPLPARNVLKNSVEFIWHFAKSKDFIVYKDAIREPSEWAGKDNRTYKYNELGKDPGNYFIHPKSQDQKEIHPAKMPDAVAERFVLYGSKPGDVVLDPFCGSGTTLLAAQKHGRRFVGYDLNADYVNAAKARLCPDSGPINAAAAPVATPVSVPVPVQNDPLMDVPGLSAYLGWAIATIYTKVSEGKIPVIKLGRLNRFRKSTIDEWLLNQTQQNTTKSNCMEAGS
ncbi:MAG: DNA methyltransferase [Elusimicrobia bacterium]|nr:DNA methyltransferase [Elusimicrobiota bacterium]